MTELRWLGRHHNVLRPQTRWPQGHQKYDILFFVQLGLTFVAGSYIWTSVVKLAREEDAPFKFFAFLSCQATEEWVLLTDTFCNKLLRYGQWMLPLTPKHPDEVRHKDWVKLFDYLNQSYKNCTRRTFRTYKFPQTFYDAVWEHKKVLCPSPKFLPLGTWFGRRNTRQ